MPEIGESRPAGAEDPTDPTTDPTTNSATDSDIPADAAAQAPSVSAEPAPDDSADSEVAQTDPVVSVEQLEHEGDVAADYLEGLLDLLDLGGDIDLDVEGERAHVAVVPDPSDPHGLDVLVGEDGAVLEAVQELTRLAVAQATGERSRLMLDIAGFRTQRRLALAQQARTSVEQARASGAAVELRPMTPFERKVVHDTVAEMGLFSASIGEGLDRRVVIRLEP